MSTSLSSSRDAVEPGAAPSMLARVVDAAELTHEQRVVAVHRGSGLVLAGAGAGKSRTLNTAVLCRVYGDDIPAGGVAVVTFTRDAAEVLHTGTRGLAEKAGLDATRLENLHIGTIDAVLCALIDFNGRLAFDSEMVPLHDIAYRRACAHVDPASSRLSSLEKLFDGDRGQRREALQRRVVSLHNLLQVRRADRSRPARYDMASKPLAELLVDLLRAFGHELALVKQHAGVTETTDILQMALQPRYQDVLDCAYVDEAQDTSELQTRVLQHLARHVVFVADVAQSIYGFRHASPDTIASLSPRLGALTTNRRCDRAIVAFANQLRQLAPEITEQTPVSPQTGKVKLITVKGDNFESKAAQLTAVVRSLSGLSPARAPGQEPAAAVICLDNRTMLDVVRGLREHGLKVTWDPRGTLAREPFIHAFLRYSQLLAAPAQPVAAEDLRLVARHFLGLDEAGVQFFAAEPSLTEACERLLAARRQTLDRLPAHATSERQTAQAAYESAVRLMDSHRELAGARWVGRLSRRLSHIVAAHDYGRVLARRDPSGVSGEQLKAVLAACDGLADQGEPQLLAAFGDLASRSGWRPDTAAPTGDANITVLTVHAAKGREFHHTVVPFLERYGTTRDPDPIQLDLVGNSIDAGFVRDGRQDSVASVLISRLRDEEQRENVRKLYVAVTRAQHQLTLICSRQEKHRQIIEPIYRSLSRAYKQHPDAVTEEHWDGPPRIPLARAERPAPMLGSEPASRSLYTLRSPSKLHNLQ